MVFGVRLLDRCGFGPWTAFRESRHAGDVLVPQHLRPRSSGNIPQCSGGGAGTHRSDAKAMGQLLVIKSDQSETDWQIQLAEAAERAQQLCLEKDGRAPWGCQWFEEWKQNVDLAAQLGQELHVFYFAERKGQGKVPWDQLCDDAAKERARQNSGLGASQTAEVAYLEKMGLTFVEHDIRDFKAFIAGTRYMKRPIPLWV